MLNPPQLILFISATLIFLLVPGPSVLYIVARGIDQGRRAGLISVLGLELGGLFHVSAAALGLSAVLVSSAVAFGIVKYLGAAYLIYLGVKKILSQDDSPLETAGARQSLSMVFWQGVVVSTLNPKTALFFFAFLPQFVNPAQGNVAAQIWFLGFLFIALAIINDGVYALLAGSLGQWLRDNRQFLKRQRYVTGSVYIGMGMATALSGPNKQ